MNKASKVGICIGFILAGLVLMDSVSVTAHNYAPGSDWLILIACPPAICLMATETASLPVTVLICLIVSLMNAVWYALLFGVIGKVFGEGGYLDKM
ncbi:MAG TPA: hypothetical protein VFK06_00285 [Candidatus Angelobacter sp.]|nr:hypothetical protein [Candidatus Angelobacter sp.]